jgi:acyl carrier protein
MTTNNMDMVRMIAADILRVDPAELTENSGMDITDGWDSLRQLMIIMEVEQQCGCRFDVADLEEAHTIAAIADRLPSQDGTTVR